MAQDESVNNIANWVAVSSKIPIVNHQHIKTLYQDARILKDHNLQIDLRTLLKGRNLKPLFIRLTHFKFVCSEWVDLISIRIDVLSHLYIHRLRY
jgi:hypothetical protein